MNIGIPVFCGVWFGNNSGNYSKLLLKKNKLIDSMVVKRPVVHFFLLGSLIIWLFFVLNNYLVIIYIPEYFNLPYISSQIITSFLSAGVYLELVIKVKKSKREIKKKQVGEENGEE